ncbi:MAG: hypothetical protein ACFCU5_18105, partial [Pleurocapsa sp.]
KKLEKFKKQLIKQEQQHQAELTELKQQLNRIETQNQSLSINLDRLKALLLDNNCNVKNNQHFND